MKFSLHRESLFSSLDDQRKRMKAPLSDWKSRKPLDPIEPKSLIGDEDVEVMLGEVTIGPSSRLSYGGTKVFLYNRHNGRRFHVAECLTLEKLRKTGRIEKFVLTTRTDGLFLVERRSFFRRKVKQELVSLKVCRNCLDTINWRGFANSGFIKRYKIWKNFELSEFVSTSRHLAVYLMIETSASMRGEGIAAINNGVQVLIEAFQQDPYTLETMHMSVMTAGSEPRVILPLTPVHEIRVPQISVPEQGAAHLGLGLNILAERVRGEFRLATRSRNSDWYPCLFLMTGGRVSDPGLFREGGYRLREQGFKKIIGCLTGPDAKRDEIAFLCDRIVVLDTMDTAGFARLFRWNTGTVHGEDCIDEHSSWGPLPAPPREIQLGF